MKRLGNIYSEICSIENLELADKKARKGKGYQYGIKIHDSNKEANIRMLHEMLINKSYKTSTYSTFKVYEPKEREVYRLPYFPDRIVHHAIMNYLEPVFVNSFTRDTYSCIKGKGIHAAANHVKLALRDIPGTKYCLKFDIKKFYPTISHDILKQLIRKKIKDPDLLWLLDEIIDSTDVGVPIGNYLSQYLANYYLSGFDHWMKEDRNIKYYFRYADDMVILASNKDFLHQLFSDIKTYINDKLHLQIKGNYQVFPIESRGLDFVGYRFFHTHTLLRKSIKQNFARMAKKDKKGKGIASYLGWVKHCNGKHLVKKLLYEQIQ